MYVSARNSVSGCLSLSKCAVIFYSFRSPNKLNFCISLLHCLENRYNKSYTIYYSTLWGKSKTSVGNGILCSTEDYQLLAMIC